MVEILIPFWVPTENLDLFIRVMSEDDHYQFKIDIKERTPEQEETTLDFTKVDIHTTISNLSVLLHKMKMFGRYSERDDRKKYSNLPF